MRTLFTGMPGTGHLFPLLPLAAKTPCRTGIDMGRSATRARAIEMFPTCRFSLSAERAFSVAWSCRPDLIVYDVMDFPGSFMAAAQDVAAGAHAFGPDVSGAAPPTTAKPLVVFATIVTRPNILSPLVRGLAATDAGVRVTTAFTRRPVTSTTSAAIRTRQDEYSTRTVADAVVEVRSHPTCRAIAGNVARRRGRGLPRRWPEMAAVP